MYKLYTTNTNNQFVIRLADSAYIPMSEQNSDYQAYLKYQAEGGKVYGADEEVPNGQAAE